jgi:hypothetical protein
VFNRLFGLCLLSMLVSFPLMLYLLLFDQIIGRTPTEKMEKIQLIGSSSPYESNQASPTGGRRPFPFKRDLMGLSLSLYLLCLVLVFPVYLAVFTTSERMKATYSTNINQTRG